MKTMFGFVAVIACVLSQLPPVVCQTTPPPILSDDSPSGAITFADDRSVNVRSEGGRFPLVASNAGEAHTINLQLPVGAPRNLIVQPLDGGALNAGAQSSTVAVDGTTSFQFRPGTKAGRYRVLLNDGGVTTLLQFWVADPQNPQANPPMVQAQ